MHFAKYKSSAIHNMLRHYLRDYFQDHIERTRTPLNQIITTEDYKTPTELENYLNKRIESVLGANKTIRKNAVKMVDLIITQPKDITEYDSQDKPMMNQKFFESMFDFCIKEFGDDNMLTFAIHMDEDTPHVHCSFIPLVENQDHTFSLSAKKFLNRDYLKKFHSRVEQATGYTLTNGITKDNKTIQQLKRQTEKEIQALKNDIQELKQEKENLQNEIVDIKWKSQTTTTKNTHIDIVKREVLKDINNIIDDYKKGMTPIQILNDKNIFEYNIVQVKTL